MEVKKFPAIFLVSVLVIMLQSAIISRLPLWGVSVDLVFVFIICNALIGDNLESVLVALVTGVIRDSFFPGIFGLNTLIFIILSYFMGFMQRRIYRDSTIIPALFTFISTYAKGLIYYFFFFTMSYNYNFKEYALGVILLESVFNSIISIFVYKFLMRINSVGLLSKHWKF